MSGAKAELLARDGISLVFQGMRLEGQLEGLFFIAQVQQAFENPTDQPLEVVYTFPLPFGATLLDVHVRLGDLDLRGSVVGRKKAEIEYEEAISDGNAAILLEQNSDGTHTLNLGNLAPNETCLITLRYAQALSFEQRGIRLLIPTVIAPRYGNPLKQGKLAPHQVPEHDLGVRYPFEFSIDIRGTLATAAISSPSHAIRVRQAERGSGPCINVTFTSKASLDRDLVISLDDIGADSIALASQDFKERIQTATLLSFCPTLPGSKNEAIAVKFLVDCSGSMNGDSIRAARASLQSILSQLRPGDRFSLSKFGSEFVHRSRALWSVKDATLVSGQRWVSQLQADMGGTEMEAALKSTFEISAPSESVVFLITDGEIYAIDNLIETATQSAHRIFVIGIGSSPAEVNLRRLADVTGGACDFIAPGEAIEPAILRMFKRLRSPRAEALEIQWPEGSKPIWETPLPKSAFDADTINVFALWDKAPTGKVQLSARLSGGNDQTRLAGLDLPDQRSSDMALSRVAAFRHLNQLTSIQAEEEAVVYQLITPYTNFLLVHERTERATEMPELIKVRQMLPSGWGGVGSNDVQEISFCLRSPEPKLRLVQQCVGETDYANLTRRPRSPSESQDNDLTPLSSVSGLDMDLDYLDVPHFLIRSGNEEIKPRLSVKDVRPIALFHWLMEHPKTHWPRLIRDLEAIGVGGEVIEWLREEGRNPKWNTLTEGMIIQTFLEVMVSLTAFSEEYPANGQSSGSIRQWLKGLMPETSSAGSPLEQKLFTHFKKALNDVSRDEWPDQVIRGFVEADE